MKSKLRNRMGEEMLASILHIRGFMSCREVYCNKFKATPAMLSRLVRIYYFSAFIENRLAELRSPSVRAVKYYICIVRS